MSQHDYPSIHVNSDEQFVTTVVPEHSYPQLPLKQASNIYSYPANCYYVASPVASSPDAARMSMSGSSTGSYSIPYSIPHAKLSDPEQSVILTAPTAATLPHAHSPRVAEPVILTGSHIKEGHLWSATMSTPDGHSSRSVHETQNTVAVYAPEDKEEAPSREPNAVLVLLLFSAPIPFFSVCTAVYTFFALFAVLLTSPLRLCPPSRFFRSTTFSTQLCQLLIPALHYHERLAQSSRSHLHHHNPYTPAIPTEQFAPLWLSLVLTLAPFLSLGLLLAVWTAAFFWIFAMILGNPDGTEKKDDGRAAVLGVNAWWQTWLQKSRKRQKP